MVALSRQGTAHRTISIDDQATEVAVVILAGEHCVMTVVDDEAQPFVLERTEYGETAVEFQRFVTTTAMVPAPPPRPAPLAPVTAARPAASSTAKAKATFVQDPDPAWTDAAALHALSKAKDIMVIAVHGERLITWRIVGTDPRGRTAVEYDSASEAMAALAERLVRFTGTLGWRALAGIEATGVVERLRRRPAPRP